MSDKIKIQRVSWHKAGWKMRFGRGLLIVTVTVAPREDLRIALADGYDIATEYFKAMNQFNQS